MNIEQLKQDGRVKKGVDDTPIPPSTSTALMRIHKPAGVVSREVVLVDETGRPCRRVLPFWPRGHLIMQGARPDHHMGAVAA